MILMMMVVMILMAVVKIVMAMTTTMLTKMEVGKKVVNKLLVGGRGVPLMFSREFKY